MNKIIFLIVFFCVNLIANTSSINLSENEKKWIEEHPLSRIAVMKYWPQDVNGNSLDTELLKLINNYSGLHLVPIKFNGWNEGYTKAKNGQNIDGIMGLSWSKEREENFLFSPTYNFSPAHLIIRKSNTEIISLQNLANKTVLTQKNEITNILLKEKIPSTKIIHMNNLELMYEKLFSDDNVDAMFLYFINEDLLEKYDLKIVEELYDSYGEVSIGINNSQPMLNSIVNKAFKLIPKKQLSLLRNKNWGNKQNKIKISIEEIEYLKNNKIIKVCANPNFEPIEFKKNGFFQGASIDILNIIKEKLNIEYDFVITSSWEESQKFLKQKKCDILPTAIKTSERLSYANFTHPYLEYKLAIITKDDQPLISNFESIKDKKMSIQQNSELFDNLQKVYPNIKIKKTSSYLESLESVRSGDSYFTISTLPAYSYFKSKYDLKDLEIAGYINLEYTLSIAVENDNKILLSILDKALQEIPQSTFDVIHDKWSSTEVIKSIDWNLLYKIFIVVTIIIIAILFYNRKLNAMVQKKTQDINEQKEELISLMSSFDKNVIYSKTDLKGNITHVSDAFCKISGYSKEELIGQTHNIVRHPEIPKYFFKKIWTALNEEKTYEVEIMNRKKDASTYWVKAYLEPEYNSSKKLIGYSSLMQDITDKKAIEDLSLNLENIVDKRTKELEAIHKHTKDSIEYASLIQHSLVPKNDIFMNYFQEYFTIWHPKDIVGGDIYLFEELRTEDECLIMVIDCTGHGVPGAFVTMLVKAIERQIVSTIKHNENEIVSPGKILGIFNRSMKHLLRQDDEYSVSNAGFDGSILYYNKKENIVKFSGAETPLFYTDEYDNLKMIKGNRHSVGYKKCDVNFEFEDHIISVTKGMKFYLTTDGYLDQNGGEKGFPFGKRRFSDIIKEYMNESFADQQEVFLDELDEYQGDEERNDDVTLIGFKL